MVAATVEALDMGNGALAEPRVARPLIDDWFSDGTLNGSFSCTDIHVIEERRERVAYHWFGDRADDTRTITYFELHVMINHATNALIELGVKPLDRVAVCSPCVPETSLRCWRSLDWARHTS